MAMGSDNVAKIFHYGKHGFARDYRKATHFYKLCLEHNPNYPSAWNNPGKVLRSRAYGTTANIEAEEAAFWKAINYNKDAHAFYNSAALYHDIKDLIPQD